MDTTIQCPDAGQLGFRARNAVENMAISLAEGGSTLGANAILWNCDAAAELRKRRGI